MDNIILISKLHDLIPNVYLPIHYKIAAYNVSF